MFQKLEEIERAAERSARRALWSIASIFVTQFALIQYGTFIAFSWDIMEPLTCGMTLGDALVGYLFWIRSGRPYSLDGLREHFYERKKAKLIKKKAVDYENFIRTEEAIRIIRNRLQELE
jgi:calcium uniporter protein, mitochondrial